MSPVSLFGLDNHWGQSAVLSPCRTWRYALERRFGAGPFVFFVGLNPSTADEWVDDPTIRRCLGFARRWGYGGLLMGNLYGLRATDPRELRGAADPVGPDNDVWLTTMAMRSSLTVCAWGAHALGPAGVERAGFLLDPGKLHCLGRTKSGAPRHPLYLPADTPLERFTFG